MIYIMLANEANKNIESYQKCRVIVINIRSQEKYKGKQLARTKSVGIEEREIRNDYSCLGIVK